MIIGHGDIASVIPDREDMLFFASGVSDSSEIREKEYDREINLLESHRHTDKHIVYFSSLSVFFNNSRYTQHKLVMESLIRNNFKHWTIMRLGNPVWCKNPKHLIPFFKRKIELGEPYNVWDTYRYPLEKEEFLHWINMIPKWNCEMNITSPKMKVEDIIKKYCYE